MYECHVCKRPLSAKEVPAAVYYGIRGVPLRCDDREACARRLMEGK